MMNEVEEGVRRGIDDVRPRPRADRHAARGRRSAWAAARAGLRALVAAALFTACGDDPASPPAVSPPITRLFVFVRDWPNDYVELALTREATGSTIVLFRPPAEGAPRMVIDSIGPGAVEPPEIATLLSTFDLWAMNADDAPGAACRTVNGQRSCNITWNDYSVVMRVESGDDYRVQRYTGLETIAGNDDARALGDFILAWVQRIEGDR